jgi:hypothetical protein
MNRNLASPYPFLELLENKCVIAITPTQEQHVRLMKNKRTSYAQDLQLIKLLLTGVRTCQDESGRQILDRARLVCLVLPFVFFPLEEIQSEVWRFMEVEWSLKSKGRNILSKRIKRRRERQIWYKKIHNRTESKFRSKRKTKSTASVLTVAVNSLIYLHKKAVIPWQKGPGIRAGRYTGAPKMFRSSRAAVRTNRPEIETRQNDQFVAS